jgi:hypothetical protein
VQPQATAITKTSMPCLIFTRDIPRRGSPRTGGK